MEFDIASTPVYAEFNMGTLIYLAFALVAFIVNQINKSKKKQQQRSQTPGAGAGEGRPTSTPTKGKSFEELLEEFTGKATEQEPEIPPIPVKKERERTALRPRPVPVAKPVNNPYQDLLKERSFDKKQESHSLLKTPFQRFEEFEDEEEEDNDYGALLSDADSARKAFVLSEIFQRKY